MLLSIKNMLIRLFVQLTAIVQRALFQKAGIAAVWKVIARYMRHGEGQVRFLLSDSRSEWLAKPLQPFCLVGTPLKGSGGEHVQLYVQADPCQRALCLQRYFLLDRCQFPIDIYSLYSQRENRTKCWRMCRTKVVCCESLHSGRLYDFCSAGLLYQASPPASGQTDVGWNPDATWGHLVGVYSTLVSKYMFQILENGLIGSRKDSLV